ncbi:hypothetical protein [Mucilaginibacter myungsuensis]|uniref:DUF4138 domain-containing protein n=1 Tax=Mucilaginibacter myungsuensis TaxID=649104 RepID=A0A929KVP4_9SPHI|nr:hypothetical protein [Mucilaginibacter myungsuensis]MBE9662456.1 hypothetical protein [Mucilaginibacter myungsuensis]MDN3597876.1 hypothetical protein [Mucilaginibacter myungsuensis]
MKYLTFFFSSLLFTATAQAQKLPNVQENRILIPDIVKIDGKSEEFDSKFEADNKATGLQYTLANNDQYLYLTVKVTDSRVIHKILYVGIALTVLIGKAADDQPCLNFPDLSFNEANLILGKTGLKTTYQKIGQRDTAQQRTDSLIKVANDLLSTTAKTIKVTNLKSIPDQTISVYNGEGIKVAQRFNKYAHYTCEMLIPLKYLGLSTSHHSKFAYQIKLVGQVEANKGSVPVVYHYPNGVQTDMNADLNTTTYLKGEYTLAPKP